MARFGLVRLMAGAILIVAICTQPVTLLGAGAVQIGAELGFGPAGLGALAAAFYLASAASSAPLGRVVARIGWQRAIRLNAAASGVVLVLIATVAREKLVFGLLLIVAGLVFGLANPAANQSLADHVSPDRRGVVFGLKHAGIPVSTLLAGLALPVVMVHFGWRAAYVVAAFLTLVVQAVVPRGRLAPTAAPRSSDPRRAVSRMSDRLLFALSLGASFATWGAVFLGTFLISASVERGFSEAGAGYLLFAGSLSSVTARVAIGAFTDRIGGRGFGGLGVLMSIGAVVFLVTSQAVGPWFAVLVIVAFMTGWGWPGLMTYTVVNANATSAATSSAITQAGVLVGAGAGPLVLGWIIDRFSFDAAMAFVGAMLAIGAAAVAIVGRVAARPRDLELTT